jgi:signal transduction histidine kinase
LRDVNNISGFCAVIEDITARKMLEEERDNTEKYLRDSRERLRSLSTHLQEVREEEKAHIARELHDELGGTLTAIKLDAVWLKKKLGTEKPGFSVKVDNMVEMVDSLIGATRRIVTELRPTLLDDLGLWAAIEWQAREFSARTGIKCTLQNECENCPYENRCENTIFSKQISINLYRILQEALTNISRYASATQVNIGCGISDGMAVISIRDNGIGFDKTLIEKPGSHGIRGMYERAGSFGGHLNVESQKNNGTNIEIKLIINEEAADE